MNTSGTSIVTPVVRGVLAAVVSLGTALALVVIPALAAQVAGSRSSATSLDAILIGLNLLVLGHGGGIVLDTGTVDGAVSLTPLGLTILLIVLAAGGMRRVGRSLELVRADGVLRSGALSDAGGALGAYTAVYAAGIAVLAATGRSSDASPVITAAVVSGALIALLGGLCGILWSLRREATDVVPAVHVLDLLPSPFDAVARALLVAVLGLLAVGMLVVVLLLLLALPEQTAMFDQLAPGLVGGIVLTLLQMALLPLLAVWALVVVCGGSITVGASTVISLQGAETGVLPALPILAALPEPGAFPGWAWALLLLPAVPLALGAVRLEQAVATLPLSSRITAWLAYPAGVTVAILLISGLATGGIGDGRLEQLGPLLGTLVLPLVLLSVGVTGLVLAITATPLIPFVHSTIASLRERIEQAEAAEKAAEKLGEKHAEERAEKSGEKPDEERAGKSGESPDEERTEKSDGKLDEVSPRTDR